MSTILKAQQCAAVQLGGPESTIHAGTLAARDHDTDPVHYLPRCGAGRRWKGDEQLIPTGPAVPDGVVNCRNCLTNHAKTVALIKGDTPAASR